MRRGRHLRAVEPGRRAPFVIESGDAPVSLRLSQRPESLR